MQLTRQDFREAVNYMANVDSIVACIMCFFAIHAHGLGIGEAGCALGLLVGSYEAGHCWSMHAHPCQGRACSSLAPQS